MNDGPLTTQGNAKQAIAGASPTDARRPPASRRRLRARNAILVLLGLVVVQQLVQWVQPFGPLLDGVPFSRVVYDDDERLLRLTLAADDIYRVRTDLDQMSPLAREAVLLYEDRFFYWHPGVNPVSLVRAAWTTYVKRGRTVGASTITMQLARYLYDIDSRSVGGKLKQIGRAVQLELLYSKNEILEAYLNTTPYGFNIEGLAAASIVYFDKPPARLTLIEALTLTVVPQSPHERTEQIATLGRSPEPLERSRRAAFQQWLDRHPQNVDEALDAELTLEMRPPQRLPFHAPHYVVDVLQRDTSATVETAIRLPLQQAFEQITRQYVRRRRRQGIENAAALLIDTRTMTPLASVGSVDFYDDSISGQVNGTRARRSPGSALKPFAYGLALDQGFLHPQTMLKDAPTAFGTYTPDNFDRSFAGPLSATDALVHSRNIPAIHVAAQLTEPTLHGFLQRARIPVNPDPAHYGLSTVLGTAEVTMEELVMLYAMLRNDGRHRVLRKTKHALFDPGRALLSPEAGYLTLEMLAENPRPESSLRGQWVLDPRSVAWKTGTSVGFRDAWAVGVFDHFVIAVWIGNFSGRGNPAFVGRFAAGPLLFDLIQTFAALREVDFAGPTPGNVLNLTQVEVCAVSGQLPNPDCQHRKKAWFIPGKSPIEQCSVHRRIEVDLATGRQVCPAFIGEHEPRVFEFWPTDLLQLFRHAGVGRRTPPALHRTCQGDVFGDIAPKIQSPKPGIVYSLRRRGTGTEHIPLTAVSDGNVRSLSWYVDHSYLGDIRADQPLLWPARAGAHTVQVRDDQGRWASVDIVVEWVDP